MKIESTARPFDLDDKRFYVPGTKVSDECPRCAQTVTRDLGEQYLVYPTANEPNDITFCCEDCDFHEWTRKIVVRVTVESAEPDVVMSLKD